jgi:excisionase family DNA binding protein
MHEISNSAQLPAESLTLAIKELKDFVSHEIAKLADHFGREFNENAREWLSIRQAARLTGLSETRIREAVSRGEMAASNIASPARPLYRIARADLDKWLESRKSGGPSLARAELRAIVEKHLPQLFKKSS